MKAYNNSGVQAHAAMKAGIDPKTARRYIRAGQGPQDLKTAHTWRTQPDPLEAIWPSAQRWLEETPELEAKMLFEHLLSEPTQAPNKVDGRALRTFQRRVTQWRQQYGPAKEVCFAQVREPGQSLQFDWTHANALDCARCAGTSAARAQHALISECRRRGTAFSVMHIESSLHEPPYRTVRSKASRCLKSRQCFPTFSRTHVPRLTGK